MKALAGMWHEWSVARRMRRQVVHRSVARLSFNLLGRSFRGWVDHHITQGRQAVAVDEARRKILMARVIGGFIAWKGLSHQGHMQKFRIKCGMRRVERHSKGNTLRAWAKVALAQAAEKRAAAEAEAARVAAEVEAARVAAELLATLEARQERIVAECRARKDVQFMKSGLVAFGQNWAASPGQRGRLAWALRAHRIGLLQWGFAWMGMKMRSEGKRSKQERNLGHAKMLMRHSMMRRYLYKFAATPARLRAEDALNKERAAQGSALEAAEAEVRLRHRCCFSLLLCTIMMTSFFFFAGDEVGY